MKKAKDSKEYDAMLFDYIERELGLDKKKSFKCNKKGQEEFIKLTEETNYAR